MRKGRDGGNKKNGGKKEKTDENSGHYIIAISNGQPVPLERDPLLLSIL